MNLFCTKLHTKKKNEYIVKMSCYRINNTKKKIEKSVKKSIRNKF